MNVTEYDTIFCAFMIVASTPTDSPEIVAEPGSDHVMSSRMHCRIACQFLARSAVRNAFASDSLVVSVIGLLYPWKLLDKIRRAMR